jgi:heme exporter protein D
VDHLGFIAAVYGSTFIVIVALVVRTVVQGRDLASKVADKDKPWT